MSAQAWDVHSNGSSDRELDKILSDTFKVVPEYRVHANAVPPVLTTQEAHNLEVALLAWRDKAVAEARNNEAGNIYEMGLRLILKRPASAIVVGGTDLDVLLNQLERKYGKDLIQYVYGDHNQLRTSGQTVLPKA
jgi:hypothetical protein